MTDVTDLRELRLRALYGQLPSPDEFVQLIEHIEDEIIGEAESDVENLREDLDKAQGEIEVAEAAQEKAESRLERFLQAENDTKEAMAARIVQLEERLVICKQENATLHLQVQLSEARILRESRPRRKRAPKPPAKPVPPSNVIRVDFTKRNDGGKCTAYDLYSKASRLDEDPNTYADAERLYLEAIRLDPSLAIAYTNLGNIEFRRGNKVAANGLYLDALRVDPKQPEALYNLGYTQLERCEYREAVRWLQLAIAADAKSADAYFNLAIALSEMGEPEKARPHWHTYLELEPVGEYADEARRHLGG